VLLPVLVAAALLLCSLLTYGVAMHLIARVSVRLIRSGPRGMGFWAGTGVMTLVTLIMAAAHLVQIALWAAAVLLCGLFAAAEPAFYYSAQNYTALGYGDLPVPERWRLLGPLEAINGLLFFGLSTAVLFAIMSHLITAHLRSETGFLNETAGSGSST
jgi:hypothetical protein